MNELGSRNTLIVILWSYGLFILMNFYQNPGIMIAAWRSGQRLDAILSGKYQSTQTDFIISLTALIVGVPLVFLVTKLLWGRSSDWMRFQFSIKPFVIGLVLGLLLPFVILQSLKLLGFAKISWLPNGLNSDLVFAQNRLQTIRKEEAVVTEESISELDNPQTLSKELLPWKSILDFQDMRVSQLLGFGWIRIKSGKRSKSR